jgi:hypothetical protein
MPANVPKALLGDAVKAQGDVIRNLPGQFPACALHTDILLLGEGGAFVFQRLRQAKGIEDRGMKPAGRFVKAPNGCPSDYFSNSEIERRAFVHFRLRPDVPAMTPYDALDNRQSDTASFKLTLGVEPLKNTKQLAHIAHVESGSVVANIIDARIGTGRRG